jgi:hypothetical protein
MALSQFGDDVDAMFDWLRTASDGDILALRNIGIGALAEIRASLATTDYAPGQCNWVGEAVPV